VSDRRLLLLVATAIMLAGIPGLLVACGRSPEPADQAAGPAQKKVTLQLNWFHEAEFIGYYVAEAKGFYDGNGLDVTILEGGPAEPAIDHVLDGTAEFAVSSFGEQKEAIAEQRRLVAVMAAFQIPPLVIFSLSESGIREPADLAGRRVGVTTGYWKNVLDETLKAAGVDAARVRPVEVDAEDLQPLYDHSVDAWLGYAQDEPIQAEMDGHQVTTIFPSDYGVGGYEGLVLAHEGTIAADPELVRRFVGASQQGWRYAVEHPDEAAQLLLEWAPEPGLEFQKSAVRAVAPLVDIPQVPIGWIDDGRWRLLMGSAYDPSSAGYTMDFSAAER
jgi:ABC-type nitrate/sulfonate/bicarbonate transport system substrate-binding protein